MMDDEDPIFDGVNDGDHIEHDPEGWAELSCSRGADGYCGQAGSEYCDFECPYR
jgi:hypothetical protein